ncbi:MAG: hypothetical protein U9Q69_01680 [Nanoarchaeota archaeon]|nr:hypothetical protein [Nanoarchaeota archaeon]
MFNNKEVNEKLDKISELIIGMQKNNSSMDEKYQDKFTELHKEISNLKNNQSNFSEKINTELETISQLKNELRKSVRSFQQMHSKIYEQIYYRINNILENNTKELKQTTENYKALSPEVKGMLESLNILKAGVSKFNAISRNISKTDFELVNHQKNLERHEWEKLKLMKKIDSLQYLIGKLRQNKRFEYRK